MLLDEVEEQEDEQDDCEVVLGEDCVADVKEVGSWVAEALVDGPMPLLDEEFSEFTELGRGEDDGVVELFEGVGLGVVAVSCRLVGSCDAHTSIDAMLDDDGTAAAAAGDWTTA